MTDVVAPTQRRLSHMETVESVREWHQTMIEVIASYDGFLPFLRDDVTWEKKSNPPSMRGFTDDGTVDGFTAEQKVILLELMLSQIAMYCQGIVPRTVIVHHSTSLTCIWRAIYQRLGLQFTTDSKGQEEEEKVVTPPGVYPGDSPVNTNGGDERHTVSPGDSPVNTNGGDERHTVSPGDSPVNTNGGDERHTVSPGDSRVNPNGGDERHTVSPGDSRVNTNGEDERHTVSPGDSRVNTNGGDELDTVNPSTPPADTPVNTNSGEDSDTVSPPTSPGVYPCDTPDNTNGMDESNTVIIPSTSEQPRQHPGPSARYANRGNEKIFHQECDPMTDTDLCQSTVTSSLDSAPGQPTIISSLDRARSQSIIVCRQDSAGSQSFDAKPLQADVSSGIINCSSHLVYPHLSLCSFRDHSPNLSVILSRPSPCGSVQVNAREQVVRLLAQYRRSGQSRPLPEPPDTRAI